MLVDFTNSMLFLIVFGSSIRAKFPAMVLRRPAAYGAFVLAASAISSDCNYTEPDLVPALGPIAPAVAVVPDEPRAAVPQAVSSAECCAAALASSVSANICNGLASTEAVGAPQILSPDDNLIDKPPAAITEAPLCRVCGRTPKQRNTAKFQHMCKACWRKHLVDTLKIQAAEAPLRFAPAALWGNRTRRNALDPYAY
jgi:hypothetical protein